MGSVFYHATLVTLSLVMLQYHRARSHPLHHNEWLSICGHNKKAAIFLHSRLTTFAPAAAPACYLVRCSKSQEVSIVLQNTLKVLKSYKQFLYFIPPNCEL
jgi:hypothetical protein